MGEISLHEGARGVMRNSSHGCPDGCAKIYAYIDRNMGERKEEGDSQNQLRPGQLQSRFSQLIEEQAKASTFKKRTADDGLEVLTPAKKKQVQKAAGKARAKAKTKAKGKSKAMGKTRQRPVQVLKPQAAKRVKDMHIANSVGELALKRELDEKVTCLKQQNGIWNPDVLLYDVLSILFVRAGLWSTSPIRPVRVI